MKRLKITFSIILVVLFSIQTADIACAGNKQSKPDKRRAFETETEFELNDSNDAHVGTMEEAAPNAKRRPAKKDESFGAGLLQYTGSWLSYIKKLLPILRHDTTSLAPDSVQKSDFISQPNPVPTPQPQTLTQEQIREQIIAVRQQTIAPWAQQNDVSVILTLQDQGAHDCSIWSLYRQWCYEQAVTSAGTTDMAQYRTLTTNMNQYNAFKADIEGMFAARNPGRQGPFTRHLREDAVTTLVAYCNGPQGQFQFRTRPIVCSQLELIDPANIHNGLWGALFPGTQEGILRFREQPGTHLDFIQNIGGHYIHVRAINHPAAQQGVRLIYSESATPRVPVFHELAQRLRNFLNPAQ